MLHLRAVCPSAVAPEVLSTLREHPGAANIVHFPGAAVHPAGDVVEANVAREAVDEIVVALAALDVDHTGAITLEQIDTVLSDLADEAEELAPGEASDAVVWEDLVGKTGEESRLNATFLAFLTIACLLAAVGIITDSPVTIVGAMVVGPEFGPLAGLAVGLVCRRSDLAKRAALALAAGFPAAIAVTPVGAWLGNAAGLFDASAISGEGHQVDFVYEVGPWSLIVAVLAGAAGMLSMTSAKSAALVGVFISVTTVPAAGYAAVAAILGDWGRMGQSLAQLAINLIGIVLAAATVLLLRRRGAGLIDRPLPRG
ncbi:DUF389 domain-containing protein [Actinokineospora soli]